MKKKIVSVVMLCVFAVHISIAQQSSVPVFISGTEGYKTFRIPALVNLPNGKLLAFCEGRVNGGSDFGNIDIVMKTSNDKGKTWSALKVVADADSLQAGNAAPVVDLTDPKYPSGRLFLFYNTGNAQEGEMRKGKGLREVWYKTSADAGATWDKPINITLQVHKPKQPQVNAAYNFSEDWRSYANGPGHATQFNEGKYKGRIYIASNHSAGEPQRHFVDYTAHGFYTDDHGLTFKLSDNVPVPGSNENTAAALSGNKLMLNMRNQRGDVKSRIVAISSNGGQNWDTTWFDKNLPDPVCQGSILQVGKYKGKNILAFCNAADTARRNNLTLRISFDEGKTWTKTYLVDKAPDNDKGDYTAYSDIASIGKNETGILYENKNYKEIAFAVVKWQQ